jgi:uncharacterized protein (DUF433 family)
VISKVINIDAEIMSGAPVFAGSRVTIKTFFDYLEQGHSIEDFLEGFPSVSREQVLNLLDLARQTLTCKEKLSMIYEDIVR